MKHKERLKQLRAEVDMLTLTATPIPRTLNMTLGGLRDLSIIATPPADRLAVKTFVGEWSDRQIREAVLREIRRGGQIYFVHNRVENIETIAEQLRKLVPEADVRVAHGQMSERELERRDARLLPPPVQRARLHDDHRERHRHADREHDHHRSRRPLGLAQLHQLRGRVGRSHHQAYAYLVAPPTRALIAGRGEAARSDRVARGARLGLHARDARPRDSRRRRAARRGAERPDPGDRLHALQRAARARRRGAARRPRARPRGSVHARPRDRDRRRPR